MLQEGRKEPPFQMMLENSSKKRTEVGFLHVKAKFTLTRAQCGLIFLKERKTWDKRKSNYRYCLRSFPLMTVEHRVVNVGKFEDKECGLRRLTLEHICLLMGTGQNQREGQNECC